MNREGPELDNLIHRLTDCPPDFLSEPRIGQRGIIHVPAVINDLLLSLGGAPLNPDELLAFAHPSREHRGRARLLLVAAWLLHSE